ncbi:MAG: hypothetical protein H7338_24095, partial [Candidatus Sericytochromatia bacterium]|nr:hypothetical protein [Candidatus Sericytochromatia bacterium]
MIPIRNRSSHPVPAAPPLWIPPWALVAAQLAHGVSWLLLAALADWDLLGFSLPGLAWVHLVALGWLTLASLAVLIHVIPGFLDVTWRGERLARALLLPYGLGVIGMVVAFWFGNTAWLSGAATVVVLALAGYLGCAFLTLLSGAGLRSVVRRGFVLVLAMLTLTAAAGLGMAYALDGHAAAWWLIGVPALHAHLGALGWLSLLVVGVSARTVRPITGGGSTTPKLHVAGSSLLTAGLLVLATALLLDSAPLLILGGVLGTAGVLAYTTDLVGILRRATVPHRPPQAFLAAGALYFVAAAGLGLGVVTGVRPEWQAAYAFVALMGWLGQMVNGHFHHIGVRVLATWVLGDDDATPPAQLLTPYLSWTTFWLFQTAVAGTTAGLLLSQAG